MVADTDHQPADDQEDLRNDAKIPSWVYISTLVIFACVVIVIIYGYLARPGWVGVSGKKFWAYLDLLIVPAALAIGVYLLNRAQSARQANAEAAQQRRDSAAEEARREREREAQAAQRKRELEVEDQRAQDEALQAYLDQMSHLLTIRDCAVKPTGSTKYE